MEKETKGIKKKPIIALIVILIGVFCYLVYLLLFVLDEKKPIDVRVNYGIGGKFELTNHLGEVVSEQDFLGKYQLIYFGYTYCPDICPTELQDMTLALKLLGELADNITPIFITIDPERDNTEQLKSYIEFFDSRFVGLRGTKEQTESIAKKYRVYYKKAQDESSTDYTMDHSSFIYFMDKKGAYIKMFGYADLPDEIANEVREFIKNDK